MYPGGYQIIDCTGITLSETTTTITNSKMANTLRESNKPFIFTNISALGATATLMTVQIIDTGARDGKVITTSMFAVSTDNDNVTFSSLN